MLIVKQFKLEVVILGKRLLQYLFLNIYTTLENLNF